MKSAKLRRYLPEKNAITIASRRAVNDYNQFGVDACQCEGTYVADENLFSEKQLKFERLPSRDSF